MKEFFISSFTDVPAVSKIDWDNWFDKPGMPVVQDFSKKLADAAIKLAHKYDELLRIQKKKEKREKG